uniref:Uncharacterized protein n=1 Tax=Tanacetum cinerariifolium TaxID=118510 RepID=A0A699H2V5_TANCI|nr:hypothetical protein [Tanacetum cinerariifolium]
MAKLNQLAIDFKSELLSEQVLLYVERGMDQELYMTRILTNLWHEVTDAVKNKAKLIEEVKELGVAAQGSDSMAYLRILRAEDLDKAKDIMNLIKQTQKHTHGKYVYISKVLDVEVYGDCSMLVSKQLMILIIM